jgi:hypothetical protein
MANPSEISTLADYKYHGKEPMESNRGMLANYIPKVNVTVLFKLGASQNTVQYFHKSEDEIVSNWNSGEQERTNHR